MTICEIVREYLVSHGYDGLAGDNCGCTVDDLMPCGDPEPAVCEAGHRHLCREDECDTCELPCEDGWRPGNWVMRGGPC